MSGTRIGILALAVAAALAAGAEESAPLTDGEIWNAGVEAYRRGDTTNALRVLKALVLSKSHGPRAAEVVAKICHDGARSAATPDEALKLREEAARAAQLTLRGAPEDAKANRNFTRATDGLAALRAARHVETVLKAAQGQDPGAALRGATHEARALMKEAGGYMTNSAERAVALGDALSARATRLADVWLPVRELIAQSVTNREQAATILLQLENAQAKTKKAAEEFGDLKVDAYASMSDVEHDFTRFMKMTVVPPAAMDEGFVAQSNAWQDVEAFNGRAWQPEALDFTRAFRAKFPAWAKAYEQQAQADTNKPPFKPEDQAKVAALATELEKIQLACCESELPPKQEEALGLIRQIRELLPKDPNGGGTSSQQNQQPQNDPQRNKDGQQGQSPKQDPSQAQEPQGGGQENPSEGEPQEKPAAEEAEGGKEADKPEPDKDVEAVLRKAQERNDEHEAEKKARMRKAPLPPNERDW